MDFNSGIFLVCGLSASSGLYFPVPHSILTSVPSRTQLVILEELFLFDAAGEAGSSLPRYTLGKKTAVRLLASRGQHKSVALHMLRYPWVFESELQRGVGFVAGVTGTPRDFACSSTRSYLQFLVT